ncbi:MAG TPA: hypothetical protein VE978_07915 [Chitinophagales bacterium]|nr:hypothetical protein [Chitinophagales bacterium]
MSSLLVTVKNKKEEAFVNELLTKLGIATHRLSTEEKEDLGLSILMKQADRKKKVSESEIMKKLHS